MKTPWILIRLGMLALWVVVGCRSAAPPERAFHRWGWEGAAFARGYVDQQRHLLLVCIIQDELRSEGPHRSSYRFQGTVVRSYKGDWRPSDSISFVHGIDSPASPEFRSKVGQLMFLLTDQHSAEPIGFEAGTFYQYQPELEQIMDFFYRR